MSELALNIGFTIGLAVFVVGMIALLQLQWHRLKCSDADTAMTSGIARTVLDLLSTPAPDAELPVEPATKSGQSQGRIAATLENQRFRSVHVCAFDASSGDVYMDSAQPCARENFIASPPTPRQMELHRAVAANEQQTKHPSATITGTLYRPCNAAAAGDPQLTSFSAVRDSSGLLVVAYACGHER